MSSKNIPRSERLQKKVWETQDPGKNYGYCATNGEPLRVRSIDLIPE